MTRKQVVMFAFMVSRGLEMIAISRSLAVFLLMGGFTHRRKWVAEAQSTSCILSVFQTHRWQSSNVLLSKINILYWSKYLKIKKKTVLAPDASFQFYIYKKKSVLDLLPPISTAINMPEKEVLSALSVVGHQVMPQQTPFLPSTNQSKHLVSNHSHFYWPLNAEKNVECLTCTHLYLRTKCPGLLYWHITNNCTVLT